MSFDMNEFIVDKSKLKKKVEVVKKQNIPTEKACTVIKWGEQTRSQKEFDESEYERYIPAKEIAEIEKTDISKVIDKKKRPPVEKVEVVCIKCGYTERLEPTYLKFGTNYLCDRCIAKQSKG